MPKKIDHELRKKEILRAALELFSSRGYEATTLADIAKTARIARPTLYQYFRNKQQILFFASKQFTDEFIVYYQQIVKQGELQAVHRLRFILSHIVLSCQEKRRELVSQGAFILKLEQEGRSISELVHKRTRPLKSLLKQLLEEAQQQGQLHCADLANPIDLLLTLVTSGIVHTLLFPTENCNLILQHIGTVIDLLSSRQNAAATADSAAYQLVHQQLLRQIEQQREQDSREKALYYSNKKDVGGNVDDETSELKEDEWNTFLDPFRHTE